MPQRFASVADRVVACCREHKIAVSGFLWRAAGRCLEELEGGDRALARGLAREVVSELVDRVVSPRQRVSSFLSGLC